MSVRLCRQASFGRKGSAAVRSLYAALLGIGGWCIGALVVLTALPTVPVDDQALAVISVGVPVGLAVYCGWLKRDSLPAIKIVGAAAALGAAILGAWLGYHVPATPLLGAVTGALGAVAAANLGLDRPRCRTNRRADRRRFRPSPFRRSNTDPGAQPLPGVRKRAGRDGG